MPKISLGSTAISAAVLESSEDFGRRTAIAAQSCPGSIDIGRRCWMRSPGTTSRAPDRASGDPDAIRCDFGLAPVAKRSGLTVLVQRRPPRTCCSGTQSATGPRPPSGTAESQPGERSRAAKPRKQACPSPRKRRRHINIDRPDDTGSPNLYGKGRSE